VQFPLITAGLGQRKGFAHQLVSVAVIDLVDGSCNIATLPLPSAGFWVITEGQREYSEYPAGIQLLME
jgi:hypothetical protein